MTNHRLPRQDSILGCKHWRVRRPGYPRRHQDQSRTINGELSLKAESMPSEDLAALVQVARLIGNDRAVEGEDDGWTMLCSQAIWMQQRWNAQCNLRRM